MKQQESKLIDCSTSDGSSRTFWAENDEAWVDLNSADIFGEPGGFSFINKGQSFIWVSEKTAGAIFTRSAAMAEQKPC
ncbi:hypothetical protein [Ferruginibacter sp.]